MPVRTNPGSAIPVRAALGDLLHLRRGHHLWRGRCARPRTQSGLLRAQARCESLLLMASAKLVKSVEALSALAHEGRLSVFRLLVRAGKDGLAAGDIARKLDVLPNTLSASLTLLANAGLVGSRRDGRSIIYTADYDADEQSAGLPDRRLLQRRRRRSARRWPPSPARRPAARGRIWKSANTIFFFSAPEIPPARSSPRRS